MYYNEKWGSPLQLFMPDGTAIGRVKGLEQNAALRKYFEENVLNTEGYVNYLDTPVLDEYYEDGTLDPSLKRSVRMACTCSGCQPPMERQACKNLETGL